MQELRRLLVYVLPHVPLLILALLLLVFSGLLEAVIVMLLAPIFDQMAPAAEAAVAARDKFQFLREFLQLGNQDYFLRIALYLVGFAFLKGVSLYFAEMAMSFSGQRAVGVLRKQLFSALLRQSLGFYSDHATGRLMARIITDTERLQETVSKTVTDFIRQFFLLLFFLGVVLYTDWKLSLLSFAIAPLVFSITMKFGRLMRRVSLAAQENLAEISHSLQETISGQKIVKAFGMEEYETGRFRKLVDGQVRANMRVVRAGAASSPLIEFIGYVAFVPFLLYANYQVSRGFTIGAFVVFVAALFRLYEPVKKLSRMHLYFQQASASAARVFELLDAEVDVFDKPGAVHLPPFRGEISFEGVGFSYGRESTDFALRDIDFKVARGEIVAIVGSSGAGKTSLVSLIPRFYDVRQGAVRIDGLDVRDVSLTSLRSQIALVTQETFLFNDTVRNNIAYGREDCSLEAIENAAKAALIHDFVCELPEGYDAVIGERGQRLSGGQRQRIAIARAVLKGAPILILDEATSALDSESERLVQQALYNLMRNRTTLVIAHRLSTIRMAHRILVLDQGAVVEEGDHERLMLRSGVYRRLYELQFSDIPP